MLHTLIPTYFHWWHIPVIFLAGLVGEAYGSVIGGGGIIIQSTQLFIGVPIKSAIATATAGGLGTEAGVISETHQHIADNRKLTLLMTVPFTLGGIVGVWLLLSVSQSVIKYLMIVAVVIILAHAYYAKGKVKPKVISKAQHVLLFLFMFLSGLYGNFIGPGEGTFSKFALMSVLGLTFIQSQGLKAAATVPARIFSIVVTALAGLVVWPYAATLWISTYISSKYATKYAKRVPDRYWEIILTLVSIAFVLYLLFFYNH